MNTGSWRAFAPPELHRVQNHRARWLFAGGLAMVMLLTCLFLLLVGATVFGCAYRQPACQVIDVAKEACAVIKVVDAQGIEHTIQLDPQELRAFAAAKTSSSAAPPSNSAGK
jgi:hypothetical protein